MASTGEGQTLTLGIEEGVEDRDEDRAWRVGVEHLVELGHHRIGLILGQREIKSQDTRKRGYIDVLQDANIQFDENLIITIPFTRAGGEKGFTSLFQLASPPTAIFCANDTIAIGALQAAHAMGLNVPGDISIVGLDDIAASATTQPPLTTVAKSKYEIGRQAATFLLDQIHQNAPSVPRKLQLAGKLCVRGTTAAPSMR